MPLRARDPELATACLGLPFRRGRQDARRGGSIKRRLRPLVPPEERPAETGNVERGSETAGGPDISENRR